MPGARAFTFVGVASAAAALRSAGAATRIAGAKPTVAERQWRAMTELYLAGELAVRHVACFPMGVDL